MNFESMIHDAGNFLKSNEPIAKVYGKKAAKFVLGESEEVGLRGLASGLSNNKGLKNSIKDAYTKVGEDGVRSMNVKAIAGTYVGAAVAGRVATGGGLYRDRTGNVNVPVVPFV